MKYLIAACVLTLYVAGMWSSLFLGYLGIRQAVLERKFTYLACAMMMFTSVVAITLWAVAATGNLN